MTQFLARSRLPQTYAAGSEGLKAAVHFHVAPGTPPLGTLQLRGNGKWTRGVQKRQHHYRIAPK